MKLISLLSGKDYFYVMHLSYGGSRKKECWNFARTHELIGLDRRDIDGDWVENREKFVRRLRSDGADHGWIKQFDLFCEGIDDESITDADVVVVLAGKDFVLGLGKVMGPHDFDLSYRDQRGFFHHVRPVEWIVAYDYADKRKIERIQFQNTIRRIEKNREKDQRIWSTLAKLDFAQTLQPTTLETKENSADILRGLAEIQTMLEKEETKVERYKRNRELVQKLKELYSYRCQLCSSKNTDVPQIPLSNGKNYVEVHHIKGFNEVTEAMDNNQENAIYTIDNYKNAITVCVYHHKLLHRHKDNFKFDSKRKYFISENGVSKMELALNIHL
jgi:hypothetical protein